MFPCFGITRGGCLCVLFVVSFFIDHEHYCPAALPPGRILSAPTGAVETMRLQQPTGYTPSASLRSAAFNRGMIATGNHHFERFAALCNTPGGSQGVLTFSVCEPVSGQYRTGRVREPMYWYKPCALLSGGTAARADSIRPYRPYGKPVPFIGQLGCRSVSSE